MAGVNEALCGMSTVRHSKERLTQCNKSGNKIRHSETVKAKFHYAILVADRSEAGRRPAASWNLAYHLAR